MSEPGEYTFRTKTGSCTITPGEIVLTRSGVRGAMAERTIGNSIARPLIIYGILGIAMLAYGILTFSDGDPVGGVLFSLIGGVFIWNVVASRNNSAVPLIKRSAIRSVEAHPPRPPFTRGYFTVFFEDGGAVRKRLIMLPGSMEGGGDEYKRAEAAMREAGLLSPS